MAAVLTVDVPTGGQIPSAGLYMKKVKVAMDSSYPTGGEIVDLTAAPLNLPNTTDIVGVIFLDGWIGYVPEWVVSTGAIRLRRGAGAIDLPLAEVANAFDVSAIVVGEMLIIHN